MYLELWGMLWFLVVSGLKENGMIVGEIRI